MLSPRNKFDLFNQFSQRFATEETMASLLKKRKTVEEPTLFHFNEDGIAFLEGKSDLERARRLIGPLTRLHEKYDHASHVQVESIKGVDDPSSKSYSVLIRYSHMFSYDPRDLVEAISSEDNKWIEAIDVDHLSDGKRCKREICLIIRKE